MRVNKTDAYRVFQKMLDDGNPPDSWQTLIKQSKSKINSLENIIDRIND